MDKLNRELGASYDTNAHIAKQGQKPIAGSLTISLKRRFRRRFRFRKHLRRVLFISFDPGRRQARDYLRRFKFILRDEARQCLIRELREGNENLEKLLRYSDNISSVRKARVMASRSASISASATAMNEFWRYADGLYKALSGSWGCACKHHHRARLALQHRVSSEKEFKLLLFHGLPADDRATYLNLKWHHHCLKIVERPVYNKALVSDSKASLQKPPQSTSGHSPQHRASTPLRSALRTQPRVLQEAQPNLRIPGISVTLAPPEPSFGFASDAIRESQDAIPDLCSWLAATGDASKQCAGFLQEAGSRYYVYLDDDNDTPLGRDSFITLAEILSQRSSERLSPMQKCRIALDLASSFVQLKSSPWITSALRKTMIEFHCKATSGESSPELGPPLIARGFETATMDAQSTGIDKEAIMALGITLSELCFGRSIEEYRDESKKALGDSSSDTLAEVMCLLTGRDRVVAQLGAPYADAIEWCLLGVRKSASGESWRKDMLQNVVAPLNRCYQFFTGGVTEE